MTELSPLKRPFPKRAGYNGNIESCLQFALRALNEISDSERRTI